MTLLEGEARRNAQATIKACHYAHSVPSGKSYYIAHEEALVVWSLPANYMARRHFLPGVEDPRVFELTRLWAPDGHDRNLLTQAIASAVAVLKRVEPDVDLVVSYADPSAGHSGSFGNSPLLGRRMAANGELRRFWRAYARVKPTPTRESCSHEPRHQHNEGEHDV